MAGFELALVDWLRNRRSPIPGVALGIGDDMALVESATKQILLGSDMLLDGVHFDSSHQPLAAIGRKAVACCLSDCAAMAVRPRAAVVSVAFPKDWELHKAQELFTGMFDLADAFDIGIVGGDTTSWTHPLVIDVAMTAEPYDGIEPVRRSGARIGDGVYVTGPLGGSLLGRHLTFTPRVREAKSLAARLGAHLHAMMDITDGLSLDLWRICRASEVGAILNESLLERVISDDARKLSQLEGASKEKGIANSKALTPSGMDASLHHALSDGEDFELLLVVGREAFGSGEDGEPSSFAPLLPIGEVVDQGLWLRRVDGRVEALTPQGFIH